MHISQSLVAITGAVIVSLAPPILQGQAPSASLEQQLRGQYRAASVGNNGVVIRPGSVVTIQKDGITALQVTTEISPLGKYWSNTCKDGRISTPKLVQMNNQPLKAWARSIQVGETAYITSLQVKASDIVFGLQTRPADANESPYRATLTFQFRKGYLDSANFKQVQETISDVFGPDTSSSAQGSDQSQPNPSQGAPPTPLAGLWDVQGTGAQIQLNPDGSFSQHAPDGQERPGHYTVNGDMLVLTYIATGRSSTFGIRGDGIYVGSRLAWVRHSGGPTPAATPAPPP